MLLPHVTESCTGSHVSLLCSDGLSFCDPRLPLGERSRTLCFLVNRSCDLYSFRGDRSEEVDLRDLCSFLFLFFTGDKVSNREDELFRSPVLRDSGLSFFGDLERDLVECLVDREYLSCRDLLLQHENGVLVRILRAESRSPCIRYGTSNL